METSLPPARDEFWTDTNTDSYTERKIVTGLIVSTPFLQGMHHIVRLGLSQVPFIRVLSTWIIAYFDKYGAAPGRHIQDIYDEYYTNGLDPTMGRLIGKFLIKVAQEYEDEGQSFNTKYMLDKAIDYFNKLAMDRLFTEGKRALDSGRVSDAQKLLLEHHEFSLKVRKNCSVLHSPNLMSIAFPLQSDVILRLHGALGELVGSMEREWLIAVLAPMKRGKSFFLQDIAVWGWLNRLNVAFFSFEMSFESVWKRINKQIHGHLYRTEYTKTDYYLPVWDCQHNQSINCPLGLSLNNVRIHSKGTPPMDLRTIDPDYEPCSICKDKDFVNYRSAVTVKPIKNIPILTKDIYTRKMTNLSMAVGDADLRVQCFPPYVGTIRDVESCLLDWKQDGFKPDIVVLDYADIMGQIPGSKVREERHRLDEIWKYMKGMAQHHRFLLFTASQTNRSGIKADMLDTTAIAEDIRKVAHVDKFLAINQKPLEKRYGYYRVSKLADRHIDFGDDYQVGVLYQLDMGQPYLESAHWIKDEGKEEPVKDTKYAKR
jgi:hypothetical protein